eukprot:548703_1
MAYTAPTSTEEEEALLTAHSTEDHKAPEPFIKENTELQLSNLQIFVIHLNTVTVRPLQKFISTFSYYLEDVFNLTYTQIGYVESSRAFGGLFAIFLPAIVYYLNNRFQMSFRCVLFTLHLVLTLSCVFFFFYYPLWFLLVNRFIFGVLRTLFGIHRVVLGASYSTKPDRLWIYSLFYLATPLGMPLLELFGALLEFYSFNIALLSIFIPAFVSGFSLFLLPADSITHTINQMAGTNPMDLRYIGLLLFDLNRVLKLLGAFFIGIYIQAFTFCTSAWVSNSYDITVGQYWVVIAVVFVAESTGALTTLLKIHKRVKILQNGLILYAISISFSVVVTFTIFITEATDSFETISFGVALFLIGVVYYATSITYISATALTIVLVANDNKQRTQYTAYNRFFFALGIVIGSLVGSSAYEVGGIELVTQICFVVSCAALVTSIWLGFRMFNINKHETDE